MLYTVSHSPYQKNVLAQLQPLISENDVILLWADGVIASLAGTESTEQLLQRSVKIYALQPDCLARGLVTRLHPMIEQINYDAWVKLTEQHPTQYAC
ncbi:MAG: sulfurtransferase complex subunit TusB [Plesiomonas sp.]|uniref:sulfurtransferase complex subunit TusB n=1 Tax=Plesiomonas sp. TaxID=2486279 RepID=UPI003F2AA86C